MQLLSGYKAGSIIYPPAAQYQKNTDEERAQQAKRAHYEDGVVTGIIADIEVAGGGAVNVNLVSAGF